MSEQIWVLHRGDGDYGLFGETEMQLFGVKHWTEEESDGDAKVIIHHSNYDEFFAQRKTHFRSREEAEQYVLPIARKSFEIFISDWYANARNDFDDEEELGYEIKQIQEHERRGLQMIRCEELQEGDPYYECLHSENPHTTFVIPIMHEYDRIGYYFASIHPEKLY